MSLYLDTSCLLKVFFPEPETSRVLELIGLEEEVIVSSLTRLEAVGQVHARVAGRHLRRARAVRLIERLDRVLRQPPYQAVDLPAEVIAAAERQARVLDGTGYCRTLDRLHLAAMEVLGLRRLLTNDDTQRCAAERLSFDVTMPY
ncbi:MAG: type II toxin-antitoxin system VapC family toxin [Deltaproteobacteria bacterium]|nr:type II toxin-antitoxin system VapC family toxin [Deltaproteobacteria bacterium]